MTALTTESKTESRTKSAIAGGVTVDRDVAAQPTVLGFRWLGAIFSPGVFLVGVLLGFVLCCYLGYRTTLKNQYGDIPRFGVYAGPQASQFPTIRQLIAYTKAHYKKGQILVIVCGSSVMNGVGQSNEELWTKKLQDKLGPQYAVVNLALRSCGTYEGTCFVAEAMSKQYDKMIFVTGAQPFFYWPTIGRPPYAYLYWDAKYQNVLHDFPERDQALQDCERNLSDYMWKSEDLHELKLGQWLNSKFNFYELWTTAGYRYFFTSYAAVAANATPNNWLGAFLPRKKLPNNMEAWETFPLPDEKFARNFFPSVLASAVPWKEKEKRFVRDEKRWNDSLITVQTNVAPQIRSRTLAVLTFYNPFFRYKYLTPVQRQSEKLSYDATEELFESQGINAIQSGIDYKAEDFRDPIHLGPTGGAKLAAVVAEEVKVMSKKLGYEK
jgi:hypothetical protein